MTVLQDMLEWSQQLPAWQRDALRRIILNSVLSSSDIEDLTEIAKSTQGLVVGLQSQPLGGNHLPASAVKVETVNISAIKHHHGVNALAQEQTVSFGPGATVVYGDNASGKSGFARILKRSCRARGPEDILGNVLSDDPPPVPSATILFTVDGVERQTDWTDTPGSSEALLGEVSVFDTHCASIYIKDKTDVAFRPFGLDVFDKLAGAAEAVRSRLEIEKAELERKPGVSLETLEGTVISATLGKITALTDHNLVRELGAFSDLDSSRLAELEKFVTESRSNDPKTKSRELSVRARDIATLASHVAELRQLFGTSGIAELRRLQQQLKEQQREAETLRASAVRTGTLPGTGSDRWKRLWQAAREFSSEPYPDSSFPNTADGAQCLLCQRDLNEDAAERLQKFEVFAASTIQEAVAATETSLGETVGRIHTSTILDDRVSTLLEQLRLESDALASAVAKELESFVAVKSTILASDAAVPNQIVPAQSDLLAIQAISASVNDRATKLSSSTLDDSVKNAANEIKELKARKTVGENVDAILAEIERKKRILAYTAAVEETRTQQISRKSNEVTQAVVTERLKKAFGDELKRLHFTHVEVQIESAGAQKGTLYHRIALRRAPKANLPRILSEGEARILSLAAFFAEVGVEDRPSCVIFDDPVSSLDHRWREYVAERLADEARTRQVIVFTHDVVFLRAFADACASRNVPLAHQSLRRGPSGSGVVSGDLPWGAKTVKDRIGYLRNQWQAAEKLFRNGEFEEYEQRAAALLRMLREAWGRAIEEVLLGGVVERYRRSVQTLRMGDLQDISESDCSIVEAAMTKTSRWVHDKAAAENPPVPEPPEIFGDIEELETWRKSIIERRKKK